jgi:hypothetical protein
LSLRQIGQHESDWSYVPRKFELYGTGGCPKNAKGKIMKVNRFALSDSDTAQLEFGGQVKGKDYRITVLVVEDLPQVFIKRHGEVVLSETVKALTILLIFLEERLYKYLEV